MNNLATKMKSRLIVFSVLVLWPAFVMAQATKLKVAYPTTVGSMAVLWVTQEARLFAKHGLDVELIYIGGSSKVVQAMLANEIPMAEIAIPAVIQSNLAGADRREGLAGGVILREDDELLRGHGHHAPFPDSAG